MSASGRAETYQYCRGSVEYPEAAPLKWRQEFGKLTAGTKWLVREPDEFGRDELEVFKKVAKEGEEVCKPL